MTNAKPQTLGVNPKDMMGVKKAALRFVPPALMIEASGPMADGAGKYGPFNWRDIPIDNVTYIEAVFRHLFAYLDGQDNAEDSGHSHIGHAIAGLGILADAKAVGSLVDTRYTSGPAADMLRERDRSSVKPLDVEHATYGRTLEPKYQHLMPAAKDHTHSLPHESNDMVTPWVALAKHIETMPAPITMKYVEDPLALSQRVYGQEQFVWDAYGGRYEGNEPVLNPEWVDANVRWNFKPERAIATGCGWCGYPGGEHVINCPAFHS